MKIELIKRGALEYALIKDVYTQEELVKIKQEIVTLRNSAAVNSTGPAVDKVGRSLNYADSLWVDAQYEDRSKSNILTINRKLFQSDISEQLTKQSQFFAHIRHCDVDFTLLNYYTDKTEYKAHRDCAMLSVLTFFKVGDFTGGDLEFTEFKERIEPVENTMVIFPGCVEHKAHPVKTDGEYSYRVSMAQFINYARSK